MFESASPYLKLFSDKAIEWHYCLTEELLKEAQKEDKLLFIHIGSFNNIYQREQSVKLFNDPKIVSLLSNDFICMVEDLDDKPETFLVALDLLFLNDEFSSGPMNIIITPNQRPLVCFSDTEPKNCAEIINSILLAKRDKRDQLIELGEELAKRIANTAIITKEAEELVSRETLRSLVSDWFGNNQTDLMFWMIPFNSSPSKIITQLSCLKYSDNPVHHSRMRSILNHCQYSALFDPIGGGFFSQANDASCKKSLFEKNLYVNSSFLMLYAKAYEMLNETSYKNTAEMIYRFLVEELRIESKENGYGLGNGITLTCKIEEADYYTFSMSEIMRLFPNKYEDISAGLSFLVNTGTKNRHIPVRTERTIECISEEDLKLLRERRMEHRSYYKDSRIMSESNFRTVKAFAIASQILQNSSMYENAVAIFEYVIKHNTSQSDGKLYRYSSADKLYFSGNLSDYAGLIDAAIELYKVSQEENYLHIALKYTDIAYRKFHKQATHMFLMSERGTSIEENCVPFRREFNIDLFKPSANSIMAGNLLSLYEITGEKSFLLNAHHQVSNIASNIPESGPMLSNWIGEILHFLSITK
jgi:Highly conserved protein containing a thioredoxin domain